MVAQAPLLLTDNSSLLDAEYDSQRRRRNLRLAHEAVTHELSAHTSELHNGSPITDTHSPEVLILRPPRAYGSDANDDANDGITPSNMLSPTQV